MKSAAIYARKSTEQQGADNEAKSVALQLRNARMFAAERGWTIAEDHVYADDAVSGADIRKLRARQRLLEVIARGAPFQVLIVREESRFSRRDGDVAFAELKQIARAGVEIWFYQERTRFTFGTFGDNIVGFVKAEAAADYRRQIARWTHDAMARKARAGHVTGGRVFGYENVRVDGHVERRILEDEAAVVREIFQRSATGEGMRTIAKALNTAGLPTPRAQQQRPRGWAPSSVREVLYRDLYRGVITWNRSKKRDADGQHHQHDRPTAEWVTVPAEQLRIVSEPLWQSVRDRLHHKRSGELIAGALVAPPLIGGRGIRQRYFLTGFSRCASCGGSMLAVSRSSTAGRTFRYVCATYWNRGATICRNGLMADMAVTDLAVRSFLRTEVLQPRIIERALDSAVATLERAGGHESQAERLRVQLAQVDAELRNLAETAARGGAVPVVLEALARRDEDRRRLAAELSALKRGRAQRPTDVRAQLRGFLKDWDRLLACEPTKARSVLDLALTDRIQFAPDVDSRRYELTLPIAFDRLLVAVVPSLQDMMASPRGTVTSLPSLTPDFSGEIEHRRVA